MLGFKSFADKTSLDFQDGVTAIVGPNGCGKSNVADAIRWVLGEQSAKALRGGAMQDVIFSGTDRRKPLQLAEVSMTLDDVTENQLQAAGLDLAYSEVTITRRVYRDGGSEYYINKTQCRLKDIQQLFMGTGVGRTSYSIMAQGNITQILSTKPDDRRIIFEEAAGITRYKAQKREALRKLEHTEQNLLRLEDLVGEVKRRIGTLQRQAGKARKYKEIMDCLKALDTQLSRHKLDVFEADKSRLERQSAELIAVQGIREEEFAAMEAEVDILRTEQADIDEQLNESQRELASLKSECDQNNERIAFHEQRIIELEEQHQQALNESVEADERLKAARSELERSTQSLSQTQERLESQRVNLQHKNEAMLEVERQVASLQEQVNQFQAKAYSTAQELTQLNNQINRLDLQKQGDVARLEKLHTEKIQLREEVARLEEQILHDTASLENQRAFLSGIKLEVEGLLEESRTLQSSLHEAQRHHESLNRDQARLQSRLQVLEQLDAEHEGVEPGTQKLLTDSGAAIKGLLIDHLQVPDEWILPVEALIGERFDLVLLEPHADSRALLQWIESSGAGGIQAIRFPIFDRTFPAGPEGFQTLESKVRCEEWLKPLIRVLLGGYHLVADAATALDVWEGLTGKAGFVTPQGDVLHPDGILVVRGQTGDSKSSAASALARKNHIESLRQDLTHLTQQLSLAQDERDGLKNSLTSIEEELREKQSIHQVSELELAGKDAEFRSANQILNNLMQKLDIADFEIERLESTHFSGAGDRESLVEKKVDLENQTELIRQELTRINGDLEQVRQLRNHASGELTEAKVLVASNEQVIRGYQNQIQPLRQRIQELESLIEQRQRDRESFSHRKSQSLEAIASAHENIGSLESRIHVGQLELGGFQEQKLGIVEKIKLEEQRLREFRGQITQIQSNLTRYEVEVAQKNMQIDALIERVRERYQMDIREILSECITITVVESGPPDIHRLTPEEMEDSGASSDWVAIEDQVRSLQSQIDSMGPVNLVAIEEYEETEQRFDFLNGQHQDLLNAKEKLMEAVNRINTETRELFLGTFQQIRANFQSTFEEIFGGGTADLVLVDEEDVLESGIDIIARPPGKKLQSISLLSGGEQTMTAVALLFAIYQVKPSPFCVLDELDAPLDESNINRFLKILKRFVGQSQFLIITHSKRTISMADTLYGVTMQERGVSKIISVRFKSHELDESQIDGVITGSLS